MTKENDFYEKFLEESNEIEGIFRDVTDREIILAKNFVNLSTIDVEDIKYYVVNLNPGGKIRDKFGMDVRVGNHLPPLGNPNLPDELEHLLNRYADDELTMYEFHCLYEHLHPFTDGNGRSGRIIWLWMYVNELGRFPTLGFLHHWYYQSLEHHHRNKL